MIVVEDFLVVTGVLTYAIIAGTAIHAVHHVTAVNDILIVIEEPVVCVRRKTWLRKYSTNLHRQLRSLYCKSE